MIGAYRSNRVWFRFQSSLPEDVVPNFVHFVPLTYK